jgi:hypothetical protein
MWRTLITGSCLTHIHISLLSRCSLLFRQIVDSLDLHFCTLPWLRSTANIETALKWNTVRDYNSKHQNDKTFWSQVIKGFGNLMRGQNRVRKSNGCPTSQEFGTTNLNSNWPPIIWFLKSCFQCATKNQLTLNKSTACYPGLYGRDRWMWWHASCHGSSAGYILTHRLCTWTGTWSIRQETNDDCLHSSHQKICCSMTEKFNQHMKNFKHPRLKQNVQHKGLIVSVKKVQTLNPFCTTFLCLHKSVLHWISFISKPAEQHFERKFLFTVNIRILGAVVAERSNSYNSYID